MDLTNKERHPQGVNGEKYEKSGLKATEKRQI